MARLKEKIHCRSRSRPDEAVRLQERHADPPRSTKVVVNVGCGEARENSKVLENVVGDLSQITGQKPVITRAASPSQTSSCVRICPSAPRSPCGAEQDMGSSWTACSTWPMIPATDLPKIDGKSSRAPTKVSRRPQAF